MAFSAPAFVASSYSKTGTTLTSTIGSAVSAGSLCVVCVASDNAGTTDVVGADDIVSVTDSVGNIYTLAHGFRNGQAAKGGGSHSSIWYSLVKTAIPAGGTITTTNATTDQARARCVGKYTVGANSIVSVAGVAGVPGDGGVDPVATISALPLGEYLWVGCAADETDTVPGAAAGFTTLGTAVTTGSSPATNMAVGHYWSIQTATASTFTPSTIGDAVGVLVAFREILACVGNLDATEIGSDTASLSGTVAIAGDLLSNEIGPDTASLFGVVAIVGDLLSDEIGSDTASLSGAVAIVGNLLGEEIGSDTAIFIGDVSFSENFADMSAQESGSDSASGTMKRPSHGSCPHVGGISSVVFRTPQPLFVLGM